MVKKILFFLVLFSLTIGCTEFKLHVKKGALIDRNRPVIIDRFEVRNINYDPFIESQFKDALRFEFFRRGYLSIYAPQSGEEIKGQNRIIKICRENNAQYLINGIISVTEEGYLTERTSSSSISFNIFYSDGTAVGQGYYTTEDLLTQDSVRRKVASVFADAVLDKAGNLENK